MVIVKHWQGQFCCSISTFTLGTLTPLAYNTFFKVLKCFFCFCYLVPQSWFKVTEQAEIQTVSTVNLTLILLETSHLWTSCWTLRAIVMVWLDCVCVCVVRKSGTGWGLWYGIMSFLRADRKINHQRRDKRLGLASMWKRELERAKERRGRKGQRSEEMKQKERCSEICLYHYSPKLCLFSSNDFS